MPRTPSNILILSLAVVFCAVGLRAQPAAPGFVLVTNITIVTNHVVTTNFLSGTNSIAAVSTKAARAAAFPRPGGKAAPSSCLACSQTRRMKINIQGAPGFGCLLSLNPPRNVISMRCAAGEPAIWISAYSPR